MQLVIDANILVSAFLKHAATRELLTDENLKLFAPEYFQWEIERILKNQSFEKRVKLNQLEIEELLTFLFGHITIIPKEEYSPFLEKAEQEAPLDDAPYIALSLALKIPLWSNDSALKEMSSVQVLTTPELIKLLIR
jgi:predicted nucleic acid-binding protein